MCIVFISNNKVCNSTSSGSGNGTDSRASGTILPFIILNNRDETFSRPTQRLNKWTLGSSADEIILGDTEIDIYAGRDLKFGGTWFGINNYGSFAILLNFTVPKELIDPNLKSRGLIIPEFLKHTTAELKDYIDRMQKEKHLYPPLNLVVGNVKTGEIYYICNYSAAAAAADDRSSDVEKVHILRDQVVSVSNGYVNDRWPKMRVGETLLQEYLDSLRQHHSNQEYDINNLPLDGLWNILSNNQKPEESDIPKTGLEQTFAKQCSSVFVEERDVGGDHYGTRSSSILIVDNQFNARFIEKDYVDPGITDITFQLHK